MHTIKLKEIDTRAPKDIDKEKIKKKTAEIIEDLDELQNLLYAESKHSLLVVIQGMDASGKDGAIRNVFGKLNPQGVQVKSFKVPTPEELSHDFLWRVCAAARVPLSASNYHACPELDERAYIDRHSH